MVIRKNDTVVLLKDVTSCKNAEGTPIVERGERTRVLSVARDKNKVVLEHVNYRWRHVRPSQDNPRGGRIQVEMPIDASNVALYCETCDRGVRVHMDVRDGNKVRTCTRCNSVIPVVL